MDCKDYKDYKEDGLVGCDCDGRARIIVRLIAGPIVDVHPQNVSFHSSFHVHHSLSHSRGLEGFQILVRAGILLSLYDSFGLNRPDDCLGSQTIPAHSKISNPS